MVDRTFSPYASKSCHIMTKGFVKMYEIVIAYRIKINIFFADHRHHHYQRYHHHHHQGIAWQQTLLPRMPEAIFAVDWHHSAGFRSIVHQICKYVTKLICIETLSLVHYWLLSCLVKHSSNITFKDCSIFVNKRAFKEALLQFLVVFLYLFPCWSTYEPTELI